MDVEQQHVAGDESTALARQRGYSILSQLILEGPGEVPVEHIAAIAGTTEPLDPKLVAAAHTELFTLQLPPYGGVFMDPSGLAGSGPADAATAYYDELAFPVHLMSETADHFGVQLAFLARSAGVELITRRGCDEYELRRVIGLQRQFLDHCVVPWLVPLAAAAGAADVPVWSAVIGLAVELVAAHRAALGPGGLPMAPAENASDPLDDERADVRSIARYLIRPSESGLWLGQRQLDELAGPDGIPRGFGHRLQVLVNLLRSAAQYDCVHGVLGRLRVLIDRTSWDYAQRARVLGLESAVEPWQRRLRRTDLVVERMMNRLSLDV